MPYYESIETSKNFAYQIDSSLSGNLENAIDKLKNKPAFNTVTTIKDVGGIKGLSIESTGSLDKKFSFKNSAKIKYEKSICDGFKLKTGARLSDGKITVDVMLETAQGFGFGIEANGTLNLAELKKNGFYLVAAVPVFGMQMVLKYNPITEDVTVILRKPLPDGNDEDKDAAAACGCLVNYVTVDVYNSNVNYNTLRVAPIENTPISNYNYNYNTNYNEPGVLENVGNGIVAVGENIGKGVVVVAEGVGNVVGGFIDLFRPKKKEEVYNYN